MDGAGRFEILAPETKNHLLLRRQAAARGSASASLPQAPPLPQQQEGQPTSTHVRPKHRKLWAQGTCIFSMGRKPAWILSWRKTYSLYSSVSKPTLCSKGKCYLHPPRLFTVQIPFEDSPEQRQSFPVLTGHAEMVATHGKLPFQHPQLFSLDFEVIYLL